MNAGSKAIEVEKVQTKHAETDFIWVEAESTDHDQNFTSANVLVLMLSRKPM